MNACNGKNNVIMGAVPDIPRWHEWSIRPCFDWMTAYIFANEEMPLFIVGMELHIFAKHIPGGTVTYLQCHVTDSDLSGLRIQLTKDGVPLASELKLIGPCPNGDGTVQMRVQVKTTMDNSRTYRCEVHSENFNKSVVFGDQSAHQITVIGTVICAVVGTVTCVIVLIGVIYWCRQIPGFVRAPTDENSSSSDSTQAVSFHRNQKKTTTCDTALTNCTVKMST
ncbi:hypothetical protein AALO_G00036560 [Alosa alosa]|uniref:Ig-like domain-containing protein n=1 Tax=Alosa alosa TaxID=278164 RepID=A0AAV6HAA2_9TELE|nr:hypothetical protein AALO_G00036560 [Alosa alosa]